MNFLEKKRLKYNSNALELIRKDPYKLEFIDKENQTEDVSFIAVYQNGFLLKHVKKPTLKICLEAIKQVMGDDFDNISIDELTKAIEKNRKEMLEIIVTSEYIKLCPIDEKVPIWENEITEITLAYCMYKEYEERVFRELETTICEDDEEYILDELESHGKCLKNGEVTIEKFGGCCLTIECNYCNTTIADSDSFY